MEDVHIINEKLNQVLFLFIFQMPFLHSTINQPKQSIIGRLFSFSFSDFNKPVIISFLLFFLSNSYDFGFDSEIKLITSLFQFWFYHIYDLKDNKEEDRLNQKHGPNWLK